MVRYIMFCLGATTILSAALLGMNGSALLCPLGQHGQLLQIGSQHNNKNVFLMWRPIRIIVLWRFPTELK